MERRDADNLRRDRARRWACRERPPQSAGARINRRILPDQTPEEVQAVLRKVVADDKVAISILRARMGRAPCRR